MSFFFSLLLINPQYKLYKHITIFYWSARLSCCLQKSIAKSLSRKYSASNGLAAKGLQLLIGVFENGGANANERVSGR